MKPALHLTRFAWLSIATAVLTIVLKATAYFFTGSVGLLSDALESGVNLVTAVFALIILTVAARPPDEEHAYGHSKAEYFSGGLEGTMIMIAALLIGGTAVHRLFFPQPLQMLGLGLVVSLVAAAGNGLVGIILLRAGRQHRSITLEADGKHLLTDVWTTAGVLVGLVIVALTGWLWLDAVIAILVAIHIGRTGLLLVRESLDGLMDTRLPAEDLAIVRTILEAQCQNEVSYHALRTRRAGVQRFVSVHVQVPGHWSVQEGHALLETIECELNRRLSPISVITHIEPLEDPVSWDDIPLNREITPTK